MLKKLIAILYILSGHSAYAGDERANGGDAIVCRDDSGNILRAEALDLYEAREVLELKIDAGLPAPSIIDAVQKVFERIPDFDTTRKKNYRKWANEFESEASRLKNVHLVDVPDSNHVAIPKGCAIEQLVVQVSTPLQHQKRYVINQDIWERLDDASKVTMTIHEIVYREAIQLGHLNSINSRYLTGRLLGEDFSGISTKDYARLLSEAGFLVEEVCEDVDYIDSFKRCSNVSFPGHPDVTDYRTEKLCYVSGSKKQLSQDTASYILSKPFPLPTSLEIYSAGRPRGCDGWGVKYETIEHGAFEEMTATSLPGECWGKFALGLTCPIER